MTSSRMEAAEEAQGTQAEAIYVDKGIVGGGEKVP